MGAPVDDSAVDAELLWSLEVVDSDVDELDVLDALDEWDTPVNDVDDRPLPWDEARPDDKLDGSELEPASEAPVPEPAGDELEPAPATDEHMPYSDWQPTPQ